MLFSSILFTIIPYSLGFISHLAFSWVLKHSLYSWFLRRIVSHVVGILIIWLFPHGCAFICCPTVHCYGKHPCNHLLWTDSWNPQEQGKMEATGADWGPLKTGTVPVTLWYFLNKGMHLGASQIDNANSYVTLSKRLPGDQQASTTEVPPAMRQRKPQARGPSNTSKHLSKGMWMLLVLSTPTPPIPPR